MTELSQNLSAYLDGELDNAAMAEVEARLASDPTMQAELDALIEADVAAQAQFENALNVPVPIGLAQKIKALPMAEKPTAARPIWGCLLYTSPSPRDRG